MSYSQVEGGSALSLSSLRPYCSNCTLPPSLPLPLRYYRLDAVPKGSYLDELIAAVKLPNIQCEHLRIPAKEARDRAAMRARGETPPP